MVLKLVVISSDAYSIMPFLSIESVIRLSVVPINLPFSSAAIIPLSESGGFLAQVYLRLQFIVKLVNCRK